MAADVDAHSSRVQEISDELTSSENQENNEVVSAVAKIIQANHEMQKQLESAEEKLHEQAQEIETQATQARTDALTLLANRRAFDDVMNKSVHEYQKNGTPFSVLMLDVDHFKKFNDTHGHLAGDQVLRGVANVLRSSVDLSIVVARYGGEEFAIIFPGMDVKTSSSLAENARASVAKASFDYEGKTLHVTMSAGLAELRQDEGADCMIRRADESLYASKQAGRDCGHRHDGTKSHPLIQIEEPPKSVEKKRTAVRHQTVLPAGNHETEQGTTAKSAPPQELLEGISNRMAFLEDMNRRLAAWKRGGKTLSVVLVQIDHFERMVNLQGSEVGNLVLCTVGKFIKAVMRDMDHAARFDDDTFALLLPAAELPQAIAVAERLRQVIVRYELPRGGTNRRFTVSIGVTEAVQGDDTIRLLERSQAVLDKAVESGRNCIFQHDEKDLQQADPEETALS